jgi:hypothetical protein
MPAELARYGLLFPQLVMPPLSLDLPGLTEQETDQITLTLEGFFVLNAGFNLYSFD